MNIAGMAKSERETFWVSLLFHGLIFTVYLLLLMKHPPAVPEKRPALYVPAYVIQSSTPAAVAPAHPSPLQKSEAASSAIKVDQAALNTRMSQMTPFVDAKPMQPVYMIGEKLVDDPLKKLLGIAISRHLYYPQMAQQNKRIITTKLIR